MRRRWVCAIALVLGCHHANQAARPAAGLDALPPSVPIPFYLSGNRPDDLTTHYTGHWMVRCSTHPDQIELLATTAQYEIVGVLGIGEAFHHPQPGWTPERLTITTCVHGRLEQTWSPAPLRHP